MTPKSQRKRKPNWLNESRYFCFYTIHNFNQIRPTGYTTATQQHLRQDTHRYMNTVESTGVLRNQRKKHIKINSNKIIRLVTENHRCKRHKMTIFRHVLKDMGIKRKRRSL